jgi:2-dehydro-3-deoxyphosphogalactonate aldolase
MAAWWAEGAAGFGTGSNLYKPGADPAEVRNVAAAYGAALRALPAR